MYPCRTNCSTTTSQAAPISTTHTFYLALS